MNFANFLSFIRPKIIQSIRYNHQILFDKNIGRQNENYQFRKVVYDYLIQGKFIRSSLLLYTYIMYKNIGFDTEELPQELLDVACSLEYLQSFLLIHDDIMDDDSLRRGKPSFHVSIHRILQSSSKSRKNKQVNKKTAESLAICMGDILHAFCYEILALSVPCSILPKIITCFCKSISKVGVAQMNDVRWEDEMDSPSEKKIQDMYAYKTGIYTFSLPMLLAYYLSQRKIKNTQEEEKHLLELGKYSGILFQIQDDIIELFYPDQTGKDTGSDILQDKKTYVLALLQSLAKKKNVESQLHKIIGQARKTINFTQILEFANELQLMNHIRKKQKALRTKAMHFLHKTTLLKKHCLLYEDLLDFMMYRKT